MTRDATLLAERIKQVHKEASLDTICRLMRELGISIGEIVSYAEQHVDSTKSTGERLREINQTRKAARLRLEKQQLGLSKAHETRRQKKQQLLNKATELKQQQAEVEKSIESSIKVDNTQLELDL